MAASTFSPGIYNIPNEVYHAAPGISRSALWTFKDLPHKYWYQYLSGEFIRKEKKAWVVGDIFHTLVQEPHLIDSKFYIMPACDRRTNIGKEIYNRAIVECGTKTVITAEDMQQGKDMCKSFYADETHKILINDDVKYEQSIFWTDLETGLLCKARPDIWNSPLVGDLKTTDSAAPFAFQRSCLNYGYYMQAAMIYRALESQGKRFTKFVFCAVEKAPPYATAFYLLDESALEFGLRQFHYFLHLYAACLEKGEWPSYGIQNLLVPGWAKVEDANHEH